MIGKNFLFEQRNAKIIESSKAKDFAVIQIDIETNSRIIYTSSGTNGCMLVQNVTPCIVHMTGSRQIEQIVEVPFNAGFRVYFKNS